jgi:hypothetical protein
MVTINRLPSRSVVLNSPMAATLVPPFDAVTNGVREVSSVVDGAVGESLLVTLDGKVDESADQLGICQP